MRRYTITFVGMQMLSLPEWATLIVYAGKPQPHPHYWTLDLSPVND